MDRGDGEGEKGWQGLSGEGSGEGGQEGGGRGGVDGNGEGGNWKEATVMGRWGGGVTGKGRL